jgi:basic membrane protein A
MKRVDLTLYQAFEKFMNGEKLGGKKVYVGATEGVIAYAPFNKAVPASVRTELEKLQADIKAGKVTIPSAFSMTADEINKLRDSVNAAK